MHEERNEGRMLFCFSLVLLSLLLNYYFVVPFGFQFIPFRAMEMRNEEIEQPHKEGKKMINVIVD